MMSLGLLQVMRMHLCINNQFSNYNTHDNVIKTVEVTLIHNWQQEVKESQLKDYKVQYTATKIAKS